MYIYTLVMLHICLGSQPIHGTSKTLLSFQDRFISRLPFGAIFSGEPFVITLKRQGTQSGTDALEETHLFCESLVAHLDQEWTMHIFPKEAGSSSKYPCSGVNSLASFQGGVYHYNFQPELLEHFLEGDSRNLLLKQNVPWAYPPWN